MLPILTDYDTWLTTQFEAMKVAIKGLPQEAIDWTPGPDINPLRWLVTHIGWETRNLIVKIAGQDDTYRTRADDLKAAGNSVETLTAYLDEVLAHSRATLESLTNDDLLAVRKRRDDGTVITGMWAILHALEHTALHVGHAQLMRQWWEQQAKRDPLRALMQSTLDFYARFDVTFDVADALQNFHEEVRELTEAAPEESPTHTAEEAADVFVTAIGVCKAAGVDLDRLVEQFYVVAAKNDAKTHETHVFHDGKIRRRSQVEGRE